MTLSPITLRFWRSASGREPVREWLGALPREDQRVIGRDMAKVQYGWPIGLPLCRPLSGGLWEVRSSLPSGREARVLFGFHDGMLIALNAFIKKSQKTPGAAASERSDMKKDNRHIGSSFEDWLDEAGLREEVTTAAIKAVIAHQLTEEMKRKNISKKQMSEMMQTSRAQLDRLLDPTNGSATIESLQRAARIVGRTLRIELV